MGRPPETGRFNTREMLVDEVFHLYYDLPNRKLRVKQVAYLCRCSETTVRRILNGPRPPKLVPG